MPSTREGTGVHLYTAVVELSTHDGLDELVNADEAKKLNWRYIKYEVDFKAA